MAYSITPTPGDKFLCKEPCQHKDCADHRKTIGSDCVLCHKAIGSGIAVGYHALDAAVAHYECICKLAEAS